MTLAGEYLMHVVHMQLQVRKYYYEKGKRSIEKMKRLGQKIKMAAGAVLLLFGLSACGNEAKTQTVTENAQAKAAAEKTVIHQGVMSGNIDHWISVIGKERGFFDKYGIELEMTEFSSGVNTTDAVVTGQMDIGMLADYAVVNRLGNTQENTELCIFSRFVKTRGDQNRLYVNADEVKELSDLAGKGFVTLPGTVWDYYAGVTFDQAGIPKEEQVLVNVDNTQAALGVMKSGDGVAFWASGTNARKLFEAGYQPILTADDLDMPTEQFYVANRSYMKDNEEAIKNFIRAVRETEEWISANKEEASKLVDEKINIPAEQFLEGFDSMELELSLKQESLKHLDAIKTWALSEGKFANDFDMRAFIDERILKEIAPENVEF